jgi:hypothetical protein
VEGEVAEVESEAVVAAAMMFARTILPLAALLFADMYCNPAPRLA